MQILLEEYGTLPTRAHKDDAGLDLYAPRMIRIGAHETVVVKTGVHMIFDNPLVGIIKGRSSYIKQGVLTDGTVDAGYTGEIGVMLCNTTDKWFEIEKGERIAQIIFLKVEKPVFSLTQALPATERGENGFGSTGK